MVSLDDTDPTALRKLLSAVYSCGEVLTTLTGEELDTLSHLFRMLGLEHKLITLDTQLGQTGAGKGKHPEDQKQAKRPLLELEEAEDSGGESERSEEEAAEDDDVGTRCPISDCGETRGGFKSRLDFLQHAARHQSPALLASHPFVKVTLFSPVLTVLPVCRVYLAAFANRRKGPRCSSPTVKKSILVTFV